MTTEVLYLAYELSLHSASREEGLSLVLGFLITGLTLPGIALTASLQWYVGIWLGYAPGDNSPLVPRLIAFQAGIVVNTMLLFLLACVLNKRAQRTVASAE